MQLRSPLPTPSASRPPAISREARSQSPHDASRHVPASFQRNTGLAADCLTRSLNITTAFCTLSGRSLGRFEVNFAVAATFAVSMKGDCYAKTAGPSTVCYSMDPGRMTNLRFTFRAFAIFAMVLFAVARFFAGWMVLLVLFAGKERRQEWFARTVVGLFRALGATFVKVGQIMSTRPD